MGCDIVARDESVVAPDHHGLLILIQNTHGFHLSTDLGHGADSLSFDKVRVGSTILCQ